MATKQIVLNAAMIKALAEHQARLTVQGFKTDTESLNPLLEDVKTAQDKALEVGKRYAMEGGVVDTATKALWHGLALVVDKVRADKIAPDFAISAINVFLGDLPVDDKGKVTKAASTVKMYRSTAENTIRATMREDWQTKVAPAAGMEPAESLATKSYDDARDVIKAAKGIDADQDFVALDKALKGFTSYAKSLSKPITAKTADEKEGTPERIGRKACNVKDILQVIEDAKTLLQVLDSERGFEKQADADKAKALQALTKPQDAAPVQDGGHADDGQDAQQAQAA